MRIVSSVLLDILRLALGAGLLYLGAEWLVKGAAGLALALRIAPGVVGGKVFVDGAVSLARAVGMSERVVGLTIVAVGTSLPELAASVVAALRGHSELAVGNVVGSNIFNVLLILGATAMVHPVGGSLSQLRLDLAVLGVLTLFGVIALRTERNVRRWEGALLVGGYVAFPSVLAAE